MNALDVPDLFRPSVSRCAKSKGPTVRRPRCLVHRVVRADAVGERNARCSDQDSQPRISPAPETSPSPSTIATSSHGQPPPPRRLLLSGLAGTSIVLVANFAGITSGLLSLDGGRAARKLRADVLYPVAGFRRCLDLQNGYQFVYPARWLADQRLYRRYAQRVEQQSGLDPPPIGRATRRVAEPTAGYGPPGGTGEENISVIVAPIQSGFSLRSLGSPEEAAERFLKTRIGPPGRALQTELLSSSQRQVDGELYYTLEYTVQSSTFFRHNLSVYASRNSVLYTLNAMCSEKNWPDLSNQLVVAADSFSIL